MIYIYIIFAKGGGKIHVLTVRDNEHSVGGDDATSSDVAESWTCGNGNRLLVELAPMHSAVA